MPVWKAPLIPVFENSTWKSIKTRNVWRLATMWFNSNWPCFIWKSTLHNNCNTKRFVWIFSGIVDVTIENWWNRFFLKFSKAIGLRNHDVTDERFKRVIFGHMKARNQFSLTMKICLLLPHANILITEQFCFVEGYWSHDIMYHRHRNLGA